MHFLTSTVSCCRILGLVGVRVFNPILLCSDTEFVVDSADFGRSHVNGSAERRLRLASSSPNVKALFDNSPATYSYSIEDDDDSTYMTPQSDYWHPLPPPIVRFWYLLPFCVTANHRFNRDLESLVARDIRKMRPSAGPIRS